MVTRNIRLWPDPVLSLAYALVDMNDPNLPALIDDLPMPVERPEQITLRWTDRTGTMGVTEFNGMLARCIQHENDHLKGTVIFDHQTPEIRAALEASYVS